MLRIYFAWNLGLNASLSRVYIRYRHFSLGMALWMADLLKMFNIDGKVHSIDINPDSIDPEVKKREDIDLIEGDCMKIQESLTGAKMKVYIQVGCVPPACWPYFVAVSVSWTGLPSIGAVGGRSAFFGRVCLLRGSLSRGIVGLHTPVNRMTDACENITFPILRMWAVKNYFGFGTCLRLPSFCFDLFLNCLLIKACPDRLVSKLDLRKKTIRNDI